MSEGEGRIIADLANAPQADEWATLMAQRPGPDGKAPFAREAGYDTEAMPDGQTGDGMPTAWERKMGFDPDAADHNDDHDNDGYTNLEEYLNEVAAFPAPGAIAFRGHENRRWERINNWQVVEPHGADRGDGARPLAWQPSRFDTALLGAGLTTVDSAGQQVGRLIIAPDSHDDAALQIVAGFLTAARIDIGAAGTGQLTQTGGRLEADEIVIGNKQGVGSGCYELSGGRLVTSKLTVLGNGTLRLGGDGVVTAGEVHFDGGAVELARQPADEAVVLRAEVITGVPIATGSGAMQLRVVREPGGMALVAYPH